MIPIVLLLLLLLLRFPNSQTPPFVRVPDRGHLAQLALEVLRNISGYRLVVWLAYEQTHKDPLNFNERIRNESIWIAQYSTIKWRSTPSHNQMHVSLRHHILRLDPNDNCQRPRHQSKSTIHAHWSKSVTINLYAIVCPSSDSTSCTYKWIRTLHNVFRHKTTDWMPLES